MYDYDLFDTYLDDLWLMQEETAELGETDLELEAVYQQLALAIADGKPIRAGDIWDIEEEDEYE